MLLGHRRSSPSAGLESFPWRFAGAAEGGRRAPIASALAMGTAAASSTFASHAGGSPPLYRSRNPRASSLYQLLDSHYETVKSLWEERFERRYGFWRGLYDTAVARYLDCGLFESGFARVRCTRCSSEFLVAFSCKRRALCPSCGAKRAAVFSELLQHEILADVPHAQWVFSIPKMLRPYFLHHRELLGDLARLAFETVREMMACAIDEPAARPGMVVVIQTFGSSLKWNPHIHAVVSRGAWATEALPGAPSRLWPLVPRNKLE